MYIHCHIRPLCPRACSYPLYKPIWHIGTTAELAMRGSYRKQHTSSCTFHGLWALTLHKRMHQDEPSAGKSIVCLRCELFFSKSNVLLIRPGISRRYSRQQLEGRGGQPLFLKVSLFNLQEVLLAMWFGCCSPLPLLSPVSVQPRWDLTLGED